MSVPQVFQRHTDGSSGTSILGGPPPLRRKRTTSRAMINVIALRRSVVTLLVPTYLMLIAGVPLGVVSLAIAQLPETPRILSAVLSIPVYGLLYALTAAVLSRLTLGAMAAGRYPRDLGHRVYGPRRLYALCWTAICYAGPLYHAILAIPALKHAIFRLFGYRGALNFQTYPDTWLRDLPLLTLGQGAYLSNQATISPNMCLKNGKLMIAPVSIGERSLIGHLTMIAPGVTIGDDCEIGVGVGVGVNVRIGDRSHIEHASIIDHGAVIHRNCHVGTGAYVGRHAVLHDGVRIPPGAVVQARAIVTTRPAVAEPEAIEARTKQSAVSARSAPTREWNAAEYPPTTPQ